VTGEKAPGHTHSIGKRQIIETPAQIPATRFAHAKFHRKARFHGCLDSNSAGLRQFPWINRGNFSRQGRKKTRIPDKYNQVRNLGTKGTPAWLGYRGLRQWTIIGFSTQPTAPQGLDQWHES
jgi:hypothetical protein